MGCGISVFDHSQRAATEFDKNTSVIISETNSIASTFSRKRITLSSPPKVFLGFVRKPTLLMHGCGGGGGGDQYQQRHLKAADPRKNDHMIPPPLQHTKEATDGVYDGDTSWKVLAHDDGAGVITKGVLYPNLKEPKGTKDVHGNVITIINAHHDHHHRHHNNSDQEEEEEGVGARNSGYDGPLWIASPSFREYCISDSDSDDSFKGGPGAGDKSREMIENKIQRPQDNATLSEEDSCIIHQASSARRVKKRRLTLRKVLTMHKPKPAAVKNVFK